MIVGLMVALRRKRGVGWFIELGMKIGTGIGIFIRLRLELGIYILVELSQTLKVARRDKLFLM